MQTITTKYLPVTNFKPARIVGQTTEGRCRVVVSVWALDGYERDDDKHARIAGQVMAKMGWTGSMIGGGTKDGMVWVFAEGSPVARNAAVEAA